MPNSRNMLRKTPVLGHLWGEHQLLGGVGQFRRPYLAISQKWCKTGTYSRRLTWTCKRFVEWYYFPWHWVAPTAPNRHIFRGVAGQGGQGTSPNQDQSPEWNSGFFTRSIRNFWCSMYWSKYPSRLQWFCAYTHLPGFTARRYASAV